MKNVVNLTTTDPVPPTEHNPRRSIYLLPNLLTCMAMFFGFYAIVASMRGDFDHAAMAIFVAMVMDGLDGRIARLTQTTSEFGAQLDSLSDMVCFGAGPALVIYNWGLISLERFGWMSAFFYTVATALRLARFNSSPLSGDKEYFYGLPSTASAGFIAGLVWVAHDVGVPGHKLWLLACWATFMAALLMVSNIRYYSFKSFNFKERVPFMTLLMMVIIFMCISYDPPVVLFGIFTLYVFSGPVLMLKHLKKILARRER